MPSFRINADIIIDSLPGIFYLFDESGRFLLWNRNFETTSGYRGNEIKKMHPLDFFEGEEKEYIKEKVELVFSEGAATAEAYFIAKDKTRTPYHFKGVLVMIQNRRYLIGMGVDISERKKAEAELRESEKNYKELFEHSPLPQWIFDQKTLRFLKINRSAIKHYGYSEKEFLNRSVTDILAADEQELILKEKSSFRFSNDPYYSKWKHRKKNGDIIQTEVTSVAVTYNDKPAILCIVNDTTEKIELQQALTSSVIKAQERERAQLGQELHDNVNQILTTVKLYSEMAIINPQGHEDLLKKSVHYLQACIDEIRGISKRLSAPSLGKISLSDSLGELIYSVNLTNRIHIHYIKEGIEKLPVNEELHMAIYRIAQEQLNNILKHAHARNVLVRIHYDAKEKCLRLVVKDDGRGFDPKSERSGIGLTNIKSRAENMKGKIRITTAPGKGCRLSVKFPLMD